MADGKAAGVASGAQGHFRRCRHDDGEWSWPEFPAQHFESRGNVTGELFHHEAVAHQHGKSPMDLAAFGFVHLANCPQIEGIGCQSVKSVSGNGNHATAAYDGCRPIQSLWRRFEGINLDEIGGHPRSEYHRMQEIRTCGSRVLPCDEKNATIVACPGLLTCGGFEGHLLITRLKRLP